MTHSDEVVLRTLPRTIVLELHGNVDRSVTDELAGARTPKRSASYSTSPMPTTSTRVE